MCFKRIKSYYLYTLTNSYSDILSKVDMVSYIISYSYVTLLYYKAELISKIINHNN